MITRGNWLMIQQGIREGKYLKNIAGELGVHPRTASGEEQEASESYRGR
jgi:hypothetical protein